MNSSKICKYAPEFSVPYIKYSDSGPSAEIAPRLIFFFPFFHLFCFIVNSSINSSPSYLRKNRIAQGSAHIQDSSLNTTELQRLKLQFLWALQNSSLFSIFYWEICILFWETLAFSPFSSKILLIELTEKPLWLIFVSF